MWNCNKKKTRSIKHQMQDHWIKCPVHSDILNDIQTKSKQEMKEKIKKQIKNITTNLCINYTSRITQLIAKKYGYTIIINTYRCSKDI